MALILCIETGTDVCSVALARDGRSAALRESAADRDHARNLAPFIKETLYEAGVVPARLDAVAVSMGPGSYTGLRIGVSLAKGMCYALGIPLIGIGSLLSLSAVMRGRNSVSGDTLLCPMIDARRMEVYAGVFDMELNPISPVAAHIIDADSFRDFIPADASPSGFTIFGDGAAKCVGVLPPNVTCIDVKASALGLTAQAQAAFDAGRFEDVAYFEPFYLKDFVVTTTRKKLF